MPNDIDLEDNIDNELFLEVMMVHRYLFDSDRSMESQHHFSMYSDHEFRHLLNPLHPSKRNIVNDFVYQSNKPLRHHHLQPFLDYLLVKLHHY